MNTNTSNKITNQTTQHLPNGSTVSLLFHYKPNFKIGDTIEVITSREVMQLFVPQHENDYFTFDIEIWDDRVRLYCNEMKDVQMNHPEGNVFSFTIKDISLFANRFIKINNQKMYN